MSDDIPPLIPETPPPMTKLDWEDDDDYMDYPHLALDLPSESSLSPDSGWNPIEELSLPFDRDVDKSVGCIELNTNDSLSNWTSDNVKNDQSFKSSSLSDNKSDLHQNNLSIWKENEKVVPWENIKSLTPNNNCDSVNELDCKTEIKQNVSSENVIEGNRKIIIDDELSVTTEQHTCDPEHVQSTIIPLYLPNLKLQSNNLALIENNDITQSNVDLKKLSPGETLFNGYVKCVDTKELSNQTSCVQNVLLESSKILVSSIDNCVNSSNNILENCINPSNNNNNIINKNDQDDEYKKNTGSCDLVHTTNSLNVPLPNRTFQEHDDINEGSQTIHQNNIPDQLASKFNNENCKVLRTSVINEISEPEQYNDSFNVGSTFQQQQHNEINSEDTEFEDFCDFHSFSTLTNENKPICAENDKFYDFETSFNDTVKFKHSGHENENMKIDNEDYSSTLKSENQNNTNYNDNIGDDDDDDDNFCDFESGFHINNQVLDAKKNNVVINTDSQDQLDYKQFCKDTFQGDFELCEEVNLQNLDDELNDSKVWKNLKDIESSPALNYNWTKSESNNVFLSSLSIDSRNILYGASWNPKVPRFAANMSNNPLEPLKASNNDTIGTKISQSFSSGPLQETVPDPEFDWKSSGLINPLDCNHTSLLDLEVLDTLAPCCTNTFQPQTWKTFEPVKNESMKCEEIHVQSSPVNTEVLDEFFSATLPPSSNNQPIESSSSLVVPISIEAQQILDNLPNFEVLQKPYLVILGKENDSLFLH